MDGPTKACPSCGADLPEEASFCLHCAHDIHPRQAVPVPIRRWLRPVKRAAVLAVLAAVVLLAVVLYDLFSPNVYDSWGELTYTVDGTPYHLVLTFRNDPTPESELTVQVEEGEAYERSSKLFVTHAETGGDAGRMFDQQIASTYVRLLQPGDSPSPVTWEQPVYQSTPAVEGLMRTPMTFTGQSQGPVEVEWTLSMKNGDTLRLYQKLIFEPVETLDFYPEDYPMDTIEDLRALVDRIEAEVTLPTVVNLHLPPVWYEGGLALDGRPINLYGNVDDQNRRTAFLGPVAVTPEDGRRSIVENVEFRGDGTGTGLTVEADARIENCGFYGWDTGLLVGESTGPTRWAAGLRATAWAFASTAPGTTSITAILRATPSSAMRSAWTWCGCPGPGRSTSRTAGSPTTAATSATRPATPSTFPMLPLNERDDLYGT